MSPTYTRGDMLRIAAHLGVTLDQFQQKYLRRDREGDWINRTQPCQFLNLADNKCSIYEVRPRDCAGFPHHTKKKMVDYMHVFKQNIEFCPATYRVVEIMKEKLKVL
jgi:Fe-S-cluster containining protein